MDAFECSVGPQADVKEFEYIAALQQTCPGYTRSSGTVSSLDIMRFLKSRYSLEITPAQASDIVLGLGGGILSPQVRKGVAGLVEARQKALLENTNGSNAMSMDIEAHERWKNINTITKKTTERNKAEEHENNELLLDEVLNPKLVYLDIVQMVNVLMIPTIARYSSEWRLKNHAKVASTYYQDELGRVQSRLATKGRNSNANEYASVEVGLSEMSYLGTADNVSTQGGGGGGGVNATLWQIQMEQLAGELAPKPDGLLEFVLGRMLNQLRQHEASKKKSNNTNSSAAEGNSGETNDATTDNTTTTSGGEVNYDGSSPLLGESPPMVTAEMVKALLMFHGESERANDDALVSKMVSAAKSPSGRFDEHAFVSALSSDLSDWDVGCEDRTSTCVYDVFGTMDLFNFKRVGTAHDNNGNDNDETNNKNKNDTTAQGAEEPEGATKTSGGGEGTGDDATEQKTDTKGAAAADNKNKDEDKLVLEVEDDVMVQRVTSQIIDTVRDGFGSTVVLLLIWLTYICHAGTYSSLVLATDTFTFECEEPTIGCTLGGTIISW
jgi:hypothetical protein